MTLAKLLSDTEEGSRLLREAAEDARPACVAAVRKMEASLVDALGGETIKGMPVIAGYDADRVYGVRVRGKLDKRVHEKPTLVLCVDGALRIVTVVESGYRNGSVETRVEARAVEDSELLAEDVDAVARAIEAVLRAHVAQASRGLGRYDALAALAHKLEAALLP